MADHADDDGRFSRPLSNDPTEPPERPAPGGSGDLGGPGSRDPGDAAGDIRSGVAPAAGDLTGDLADAARRIETREEAERLAAQVFQDDPPEDSEPLRSQADAQGHDDARPETDTSRAQAGGFNNDSL